MSKVEPYYLKTFERHEADKAAVERGEKPHLRFNKKLGLLYVAVIQDLKHYKGEKAGEKIVLEEWQKKVIAILFGWQRKREDGRWVRRFRTGLIFIPRKNGKTVLGSASAVADSIIRADQGGEVAFFATKKDQAKLAYTPAKYMLQNNEQLKKYTSESYGRLKFTKSDTEFYTLGRDSDTLDGLNVSFGLADEHHAHKDDSLWDVVKSSQMARREPFMLSITTAGFKITSPAKRLYDYAKKVLDGALVDDFFFAFIAEAPKKPDNDENWYFNEEVWKAANPNYGVSVDSEEFAIAAKEAYERPDKLNNFLVKYLNVWTTSKDSFIPLHLWHECKGKIDTRGKFIGGLDMSLRDDFTAYAKVYKIDTKYHVKVHFYIPAASVQERERELGVPLTAWVNSGHITATEGNSVDEDYILRDVRDGIDDMEAFCYDPNRARRIINELESDGYEGCTLVRQTAPSLSEPTSYLLKLIKDGDLVHDGCPVLTWMASNMIVIEDSNGNIKPDKSDYNNKIDGLAAIINTFAYLIHEAEESETSVYEERGIREL